MLEHVAADIGDHPLAEPIHRVEPRRAGQRQHEADAGQRGEIFVDQIRLDPGEAEIDHAPDGERHGQRGRGRDQQRDQRRGEHPLVAQEIGPQAPAAGGARRVSPPPSGALRESCRVAVVSVRLLVTSCTRNGPSFAFTGQTLRAKARRRQRVRAAPIRRSLAGSSEFRYRLRSTKSPICEGRAMKKDIHPAIPPHQGGDDRRHRVQHLFDLWRRGRHAQARHRSEDPPGLDRRRASISPTAADGFRASSGNTKASSNSRPTGRTSLARRPCRRPRAAAKAASRADGRPRRPAETRRSRASGRAGSPAPEA